MLGEVTKAEGGGGHPVIAVIGEVGSGHGIRLPIGLQEVGGVLSWCLVLSDELRISAYGVFRTVSIESFVHLPKCTSTHGYR